MVFRKAPPSEAVPGSPEKILLQLPRRKIPGVLLHQGQIMQRYVAEAQSASDVALQLPTGSGKTLVGLLIGEWRRIKNSERVVYLCPTRQLVNQVVAQAEGQYGLSVHGFTGSKGSYDPTAKAEYQAGARLAVTTYNSLFNTNPFFDSSDIIIVDDAHAAENYISSMWSLRIDRYDPEHLPLHQAICEGMLKPLLDGTDYGRLTGQLDNNLVDISVGREASFSSIRWHQRGVRGTCRSVCRTLRRPAFSMADASRSSRGVSPLPNVARNSDTALNPAYLDARAI